MRDGHAFLLQALTLCVSSAHLFRKIRETPCIYTIALWPQVHTMNKPWGQVYSFEEIKAAVEKYKPTVLALVHAGMSTHFTACCIQSPR